MEPLNPQDEIEELKRQLREAQRGRQEEEARAQEAETHAQTTRLQTLQQFLQNCHSLDASIRVIKNPTTTTQGVTTDPAYRIYPRRIVPSPDFATEQLRIWRLLSASEAFSAGAQFPSAHQMDYVRSTLMSVSSEMSLRYFEHAVVESIVTRLLGFAYRDPVLREVLGLEGNVTFESHTNLEPSSASLTENVAEQSSTSQRRSGSSSRRVLPKLKGKGGMADNFCIYRTADGQEIPVLAIEYKAPHKLSVEEIATGLESEIQPGQEIINKHSEDFAFASKSLAAAVITQLFSCMVTKGIRFGYVCTGEALVFLNIPDDDPTLVYYSLSIPSRDVASGGDETWLHRTAVAQVFAFVLRALRTRPPPMSWFDKAATLDTWAVDYDDILKRIPPSVRKEKRAMPYKPSSWKGRIRQSPIQTRSRRKLSATDRQTHKDDDARDGSDGSGGSNGYNPPSPSPSQAGGAGKAAAGAKRKRGDQKGEERQAKEGIEKRLFCTQECLLGLACGGRLDEHCPNFRDHGSQHIGRLEFLRLIRHQLATDRERDADCMPLCLSGAIGALFKVRLSSHGYTLAAKGVETSKAHRLRHEKKLYARLAPIQGKHVPVCLGIANLKLPWYFDGGIFEHFLFLGWAGRPIRECIAPDNKAFIISAVTNAFREMHKLRVLHCDAEARNMLYDAGQRRVMVVDFERAVFQESRRQQPDSCGGKHRGLQKLEDGGFSRELKYVKDRISGICKVVN